jgi:hypothetical protein
LWHYLLFPSLLQGIHATVEWVPANGCYRGDWPLQNSISATTVQGGFHPPNSKGNDCWLGCWNGTRKSPTSLAGRLPCFPLLPNTLLHRYLGLLSVFYKPRRIIKEL